MRNKIRCYEVIQKNFFQTQFCVSTENTRLDIVNCVDFVIYSNFWPSIYCIVPNLA